MLLPCLLLCIAGGETPAPRVEVRFTAEAHAEPITGRVYVAFAKGRRGSPIEQADSVGAQLFGLDVADLAPDHPATVDDEAYGNPLPRLRDLPPGDYQAQAFISVYTRLPRADGHAIFVHMDHWEGQDWKHSPGNIASEVRKVHVDASAPLALEFTCEDVIPPLEPPRDTESVKRFRIESPLLSKFWGVPVSIGATVLLPRGYDEHPDARYPVIYDQGHFSAGAPGRFGRGGKFDAYWNADDTPRFLLVTFQHPTPYYDDSYAVNSANNGPYGDALVGELIPEIERRFRAIPEGWARVLTGGSTGGWESLALQIFYPDAFNGTWSLCPDPLDFRYHQIVNIYADANAYWIDKDFTRVERPCQRRPDGTVLTMMKDENHYELAVGEHSRSGGQWDGWEAAFSPVGDDGYPKRLWDKRTGVIDHDVAEFWKKNYDLRNVLETRWSELGPKLVGKLHIYVGDADSYYLDNGVRLMEEFLTKTTSPAYGGSVEYGDGKPHCWGPDLQELVAKMAARIESTAPGGGDVTSWRY